ncbi:ATP-dependent nuclease [Marinomonas fungiae]|uniref:ATP-dependent nuclease n=1 Tax=Marinomonas fungiae TaxID=1137284 RepID=UPI003A918F90
MHRIAEMEINNYRSCKNTKVKFEPFTPLVGYNNAGKSNILKCIDALVRGKAQTISSFYDPQQPIEIIALLEGLDEQALSHLSPTQRASLDPYIESGKIKIRFHQASPGTGKGSVIMGVCAPSKVQEDWSNPNGLPQAITTLFPEPTFINSMEDSAEDVSKYKVGNTIGKLILNLQKQIVTNKGEEINKALSVIGNKLNLLGSERLKEFSDFDESINEKVKDFFPGLELNLDIPTPDISDLFKQGNIVVSENGSQQVNTFSDMGHGAQRAIQMTLIRHLAEITKDVSKDGKTNLLLIDEPELFLHPQAIEQIRGSLKTLSEKGYQVVFSTHSPFMIDQTDIPITNIVRKNSGGTRVELRLKEAIGNVLSDNEAQARLLFDTYNLGQILFSDRVIIAEGDTEKHVLPNLFKAFTGKTLGESKLALVIANGSNNLPGMLSILNEMNIPAKVLADLDFAFTVAKSKGLIEKDNEDLEACLDIVEGLQEAHGFCLNGRNPCNGNGFKASDIFELLAQNENAKERITNIRSHFKKQFIWVWSKGAIEPHLSLEAKATGEWYLFKQKLMESSIDDVLEDKDHIREFVDWCVS